MPNLSIKDVPSAWAERLRQRAARHHRSLQGELMAILEQATAPESSAPNMAATNSSSAPLTLSPAEFALIYPNLSAHASTSRGSKTVERLHAEHLARFPAPIAVAAGARSADMVREDRDAR